MPLPAFPLYVANTSGLLGKGEFIVVLDSQDRENEGDLIIAAEAVTTEKMAFMIRYTRSVRYSKSMVTDSNIRQWTHMRPHLLYYHRASKPPTDGHRQY